MIDGRQRGEITAAGPHEAWRQTGGAVAGVGAAGPGAGLGRARFPPTPIFRRGSLYYGCILWAFTA
jgi:hypothetical protein